MNIVKFLGIFILISILGLFGWHFIFKKSELLISIDSQYYNLKDITKKSPQNYDYIQVYVYPKNINIECLLKNDCILYDINKIKDNFGNILLYYDSRNLKNQNEKSFYFDFEKQKNDFFEKINFLFLDFNLKNKNQYFKYVGDISLNHIQKSCIDSILMSNIGGNEYQEKIILDLIKKDCGTFIDNNIFEEKLIPKTYKVKINIENAKILIKFFKTDKDLLKELSEYSELIDYKREIIIDIKN